jgi:hypothetical protein
MSDTPRTDAASVSRAFIEREMDYYSHQFVLAGPMRDLERELATAKAEVERLREAAGKALAKLEELRELVDSEWGSCRNRSEIDAAGDQWTAVNILRAILKEPK